MTLTGTRIALESELGCALTEVPRAGAVTNHNTHYQGTLPNGTSLFIKLISDSPGYHTAEIRAAQILPAHSIAKAARLAGEDPLAVPVEIFAVGCKRAVREQQRLAQRRLAVIMPGHRVGLDGVGERAG